MRRPQLAVQHVSRAYFTPSMDADRIAQEKSLHKAASRQGMQARMATETSKFSQFENVVGLWDFAAKGAVGEPGDDSSISGLMTFGEAREWMAEFSEAESDR